MTTPLVTREQAGLRAPRSRSTSVQPAHLTAHYGGPSPWGNTADRSTAEAFLRTTSHDRCPSIWRAWQAFHMDGNGWSDVAYSSAVCPHGVRYEGRGPGVRTAANGTNAGNAASYATVYIAGDGDPLTDQAKAGFLDERARLGVPLDRTHDQWKATGCPGSPLRVWVRAGAPAPTSAPQPPPVLPPVLPPPLDHVRARTRDVQRMVGVHPDGLFGPRTADACNRLAFGWSPYVGATGYRGRLPLPGNGRADLVAWYQGQANRRFGTQLTVDGQMGPATNHVIVVLDGQADGIAGARALQRSTT